MEPGADLYFLCAATARQAIARPGNAGDEEVVAPDPDANSHRAPPEEEICCLHGDIDLTPKSTDLSVTA